MREYYMYHPKQQKFIMHLHRKNEQMLRTIDQRYVEVYTICGYHRLDLLKIIESEQLKESLVNVAALYTNVDTQYIIKKVVNDLIGRVLTDYLIDNKHLDKFIKFISREIDLIDFAEMNGMESLSRETEELYEINNKI